MNNQIRTILLLFTILFAIPGLTKAQEYQLSTSESKTVITGTSSIHDWEMDVTKFSSGFTLSQEGNAVKKIENVTFSCKAADIRSDNSIMNKKTQDALKADDFPEIRFAGTSISDLASEGNKIRGTVKGKLTLAGQTRDVSVPFTGTINDANININASADLTFSGFGMEPPTAMLGTLKTGNKITVIFNLIYNKK